MNILLVGGLSVNPDRFLPIISAHTVYGIWESTPNWSASLNAAGPYVEIPTITINDIKDKKIDVVWSLLSPWDGLDVTLAILKRYPNLPVIRQTQGAVTPWWHNFVKNRAQGEQGNYEFSKLKNVLERSTGLMFVAEKYRECLISQGVQIHKIPYIISNGMAYNNDLVSDDAVVKLRNTDNEPHIALIGREKHPSHVLARNRVHVHYHSLNAPVPHAYTHSEKYLGDAHLIQERPVCIQKLFQFKKKTWHREFTRYDAGLMHFFNPNGIDVFNGVDINVPGRVNTYMMHGLPPIISDKESAIKDFLSGAACAVQFTSYNDLIDRLKDSSLITRLQKETVENRHKFSMQYEFDNNVLPFLERFV